jgi:hypothetical protein
LAKRLSLNEVIMRSTAKHGGKYDYSNVTAYHNEQTELSIICPIHGDFRQKARDHMKGKGCRRCGYVKTTFHTRMSRDDFIMRAKLLHKGRFEYDQVVYVNDKTLVTLFCHDHNGTFQQTPRRLLRGRGCKQCKSKNQPLPFTYYMQKFKMRHGERFQYLVDESSRYRNCDYIDIICPLQGGIFPPLIS